MIIRIGDAIKQAVQQAAANSLRQKEGLWVPPDLIRGKHYGGFEGYDDWIRDCIVVACQNGRGLGQDELAELSALALWVPGEGVLCKIDKHDATLVALERFLEGVPGSDGLSDKFREQIRLAHGQRQRGTLLVIALRTDVLSTTGEIKGSVSSWAPASIEEAVNMPKQKYLLG